MDPDPTIDLPPDPTLFIDDSPDADADIDLAVLCDALQDANVARVDVEYSGFGDSGHIDNLLYTHGDEANKQPIPSWVHRQLRELAEENYIPEGFEINEGGQGTLTIYPFLALAELTDGNNVEGSEPMSDLFDSLGENTTLPEALRTNLEGLGISSIRVTFDGCADSGTMEYMEAFNLDNHAIELDSELAAEIEEYVSESVLSPGWEINEGSYGAVILDVTNNSVDISEAMWRTTETTVNYTRWKLRKE